MVKSFDGVFDLEWLADDERVESAGDGSGAVIVRSPRGDVRVEVGDRIEMPIREIQSGVSARQIRRDELAHIATAELLARVNGGLDA